MMKQSLSGKYQLAFLEGVSKVRYSLSIVAEILNQSSENIDDDRDLLAAAEKICTDSDLNFVNISNHCNTLGPSIYLVRLLTKRYGMPCLKFVAEAHKWILPDDIKPKEVSINFIINLYQYLYYA